MTWKICHRGHRHRSAHCTHCRAERHKARMASDPEYAARARASGRIRRARFQARATEPDISVILREEEAFRIATRRATVRRLRLRHPEWTARQIAEQLEDLSGTIGYTDRTVLRDLAILGLPTEATPDADSAPFRCRAIKRACDRAVAASRERMAATVRHITDPEELRRIQAEIEARPPRPSAAPRPSRAVEMAWDYGKQRRAGREARP